MSNTIKQLIKYVFFGITTTLVNFVVFYILKKAGMTSTSLGLTAANGIAWVIAVIYAYITNKLWVFESENREFRFVLIEGAKFFAGRIFSGIFEIFLPTPLSAVIKQGFKISLFGKEMYFDNQWIAKVLVSVLVIILNFVISKLLVFNKKNPNTQ